jgi:hypothetical protein
MMTTVIVDLNVFFLHDRTIIHFLITDVPIAFRYYHDPVVFHSLHRCHYRCYTYTPNSFSRISNELAMQLQLMQTNLSEGFLIN